QFQGNRNLEVGGPGFRLFVGAMDGELFRRREQWPLQPPETVAAMFLTVRLDNQARGSRRGLDQSQALRGIEYTERRGQQVGGQAIRRDDGGRGDAVGRAARARVDEMRVALPVDPVVPKIAAARGDGGIRQA